MSKKKMKIKDAYDLWASQYDANKNRTRDIEAIAFQEMLSGMTIKNCLEIGCGTGKNTEWLLSKANYIHAIDFSANMLSEAKRKITSDQVFFYEADILSDWTFAYSKKYDLICFSLILAHVKDLDSIFKNIQNIITDDGVIYIGEFHPFKYYAGGVARFDIDSNRQVVETFTHHLSDFVIAAKNNGFKMVAIKEYFDDGNKENIPRILSLLFKKESI